MKIQQTKDKLIRLYNENKAIITANDTGNISALRETALADFERMGFPTTKAEAWKDTNLTKQLSREYMHEFQPAAKLPDFEDSFKFHIPGFDAHIVSLYNGRFFSNENAIHTFPDGTILASMSAAFKAFPELIKKHYNQYIDKNADGFTALNTSFAQDGIFIYVPDNVQAEKTIQIVNMVNIINFVQSRFLVILGKNSSLKVVHSDDSYNDFGSFSNIVTEIAIGENASLEYYKFQHLNDNTTMINNTFIDQKANSRLNKNIITFRAGVIRNDIKVNLDGEGIDSNVYGLYILDKAQHVDNQVFVRHAKPHCLSNELFKGILDDQSSAAFKGHVLVEQDAQVTNAFQTNNNILLTDKTTINTKPFLEIYADDVKCSHGATIGQLDDEALFYIRSRGVGRKDAQLLLLYAFAAEVVEKIAIVPLKDVIDDLVKKRLRGELAICDLCILQCANPNKATVSEKNYDKL